MADRRRAPPTSPPRAEPPPRASAWDRLAPARTPDDERCACGPCPGLVLSGALGPNPLRCLRCGGEVDPQHLGLPDALAAPLAAWRDVDQALRHLWRDQGAYAAFAEAALRDPRGAVNVRGEAVRAGLAAHLPTYLSPFDQGEPTRAASAPICRLCPRCAGSPLRAVGCFAVCDACAAAFAP